MPEFGGLQIEERCVRCGRLPTADIALFEMKNHLYICSLCRQDEEQRKQITWIDAAQAVPLAPPPALGSTTKLLNPSRTRSLAPGLPADSVFSLLDMPLDTPTAKLTEGIRQKMAALMRQADSAEKKLLITTLRDWRGKLQDEQSFEAYRNSLKPAQPEGSALSVGGQPVLTAQEFLAACEASQEGWADGERYLRTGRFRQWILFQLDDRNMAVEARNYQNWTSVSNFRALNTMLYCLIVERPFRFYKGEQWQPLEQVPSATTPIELAQLCDIQWRLGEQHLYEGAMLYWLEHSCAIKGLHEYYNTSLIKYTTMQDDRGVGLELLLEKAVPELVKPQLEVTFDGELASCTIPQGKGKRWDRELRHAPIAVNIVNTTRGFVSLNIALQAKPGREVIDWISLPTTPSLSIQGRPGAGFPIERRLMLMNIEKLNRGEIYKRELRLAMLRELGQPPVVTTYPITLKTMYVFQGLRGILWYWGLRGNLPGLFWNFLAGTVFTYLFLLFIPAIIPHTVFTWDSHVGNTLSFEIILQAVLAGTVLALHLIGTQLPGTLFPLIGGGILGCVGFWVGLGRGHMDYSEKRSAANLRTGSFWLCTLSAIVLLLFNGGGTAVVQASQVVTRALQNGTTGSEENIFILYALEYAGGAFIAALLIFIIACIIAFIRSLLERYLRTRYHALLNQPGRA